MNTIKALTPYRTETFRSTLAQARASTSDKQQNSESGRQTPRSTLRPQRSPAFLAQLIVQSDADLRKALGRGDIIAARQNAYQDALANRPSATPLRFLHVVGEA